MTGQQVRRFGFAYEVRPETREEYLRLHREVWPGVESALREHGIRDFSIFVLGDTLFATYEFTGDDVEAAMARIDADPTSRRWAELTHPLQRRFGGVDDGPLWREMELAWHMD
ncbi:L-rhamnose mutarotase [Agromyces sp. NPDC058104]|uniref:L-rhamnose mutarotase n=1 Tax=Agromyces sp. NPDC058104 TaxID=3346342 RepID=UPI0036DE689C